MTVSRRCKVLNVTPEVLENILKGHRMEMVETNLPPDAQILSIRPAPSPVSPRLYEFLLESETWDEVPEAVIPPEFAFTATRVVREESALLDLIDRDKPHIWLYMFDEPAHCFIIGRTHAPGWHAPDHFALCGYSRHSDMRISSDGGPDCKPCVTLLQARRRPLTS